MPVHTLGCVRGEEPQLRKPEFFIINGKPAWSSPQRKTSLLHCAVNQPNLCST